MMTVQIAPAALVDDAGATALTVHAPVQDDGQRFDARSVVRIGGVGYATTWVDAATLTLEADPADLSVGENGITVIDLARGDVLAHGAILTVEEATP